MKVKALHPYKFALSARFSLHVWPESRSDSASPRAGSECSVEILFSREDEIETFPSELNVWRETSDGLGGGGG